MTAAAERARAPAVIWLHEVDSTQSHVFLLAAEDAPDGTTVVADVQTAGRGRRGRRWRAEPGTSLLVSILVRPRLTASMLPLLSLATAVALAETLADTGVPARIKWPNDVLARGRKIAGILLESRMGAETIVAVGIGVNLLQRGFDGDLEARATSAYLETGRALERGALLQALLVRFASWRARLENDGFDPVRERWLALNDTIGDAVSIDGVTGLARDLDRAGALLVDDGTTVHRMIAGALDDAARR
jgi:BirA family biotin operon repressor/biotin-[acetyl-CoA-carboxylase] ligase